MDTNTPNDLQVNDIVSDANQSVEEKISTDPIVDQAAETAEQLAGNASEEGEAPLDPEHPGHHAHNSAMQAAHVWHSAVKHARPKHGGLDL